MSINMDPETEQYLLESIKRFFAEELEEDIGDLKTRRGFSASRTDAKRAEAAVSRSL